MMYNLLQAELKKEAKTQYKQEKKFEQEHGIVSNSQLARSSRTTAARTGCILIDIYRHCATDIRNPLIGTIAFDE